MKLKWFYDEYDVPPTLQELARERLRQVGKSVIRFIYGQDPFGEIERRIRLADESARRDLEQLAESIGAKCNHRLNAYPHLRCTEPFGFGHAHRFVSHKSGEQYVVCDGAVGPQGAQSRLPTPE